MTIETQDIEYKDFSKSPSIDKKNIVSKLFKEISAFANAAGGLIVVGKDDKSGNVISQPAEVLKILENDPLTSAINRLADNLVVFTSVESAGVVTITVQVSADVISAALDSKGLNKGDCYVRQNHEAILAKGAALTRLVERKNISRDNRLDELRKIVHYKFSKGDDHATKINIFDSLVVTLKAEEPYINTTFDSLMMNQFIGGYQLPLSKYTTIQMHLEAIAAIVSSSGGLANTVVSKRDAFNKLKTNRLFIESFFESHRDSVLMGQEVKNYILEYRNIIK